ncbi:MAG: hypothetical protein JST08_03005 [Actinobacteria bacterium]|nr:hypothetical protein [Actinomycetota bacterium]
MVGALLAFAATASAEVRTGETSAVFGRATSPEATLVKGDVSYDTTAGTVTFNVTTAAAPHPKNEKGELSSILMNAALFTTSGECASTLRTLQSAGANGSPVLAIPYEYAEPTITVAKFGDPLGAGYVPIGAAEKTVAGTTTTFSVLSTYLVAQTFNCAIVYAGDMEASTLIGFPIKGPPPPPSSPAPIPAPAPAPTSPALSIAKVKPLKLKVGKSRKLEMTVTNTGTAATTQGSLRVKPIEDVRVRPEKQKLPSLAPTESWTVSFRVELTKKAKKSSTLSVTGAAGGVTAKSSLVIKLQE